MKRVLCFSIFVTILEISVPQNTPYGDRVDTVFSKGGTCVYKIYDDWKACMNAQQERLDRETSQLSPYVTLAEQQESINKIGCCAYWEFLSCIERAAEEKCVHLFSKDRMDMESYSKQLGSVTPHHICKEQYPRHTDLCSGSKITTFSWILCFITLIINLYLK